MSSLQLPGIFGSDGMTEEAELDAVLSVEGGANGPVLYVGSRNTRSDGEQ